MKNQILGAGLALMTSVGAASAATVFIDFESGTFVNGDYVEDGFTFMTTRNSGNVILSNDCGSTCLQLNNNETVTVTYTGNGAFDLDGFQFRAPGDPGDLTITGGTVTENAGITGNDLSSVSYTTEYDGIFSFSWTNLSNGSGRVDSISLTPVAAVPLPAGALLLLTGMGALVVGRRRKSA